MLTKQNTELGNLLIPLYSTGDLNHCKEGDVILAEGVLFSHVNHVRVHLRRVHRLARR